MITTKIVVPAYFPKSEIKENGPSVALMTITKEIAGHWLKTYNLSNRPINRANVRFLSDQIKRQQWKFNGDSYSFLPDGTLNDSQHRLTAIFETGVSVLGVVVVGVDPDAFKTKDTGKKRSGGDVLAIEGHKYYAMMSAVSTFLISWEAGKFSGATSGKKSQTSNTDISNFAEKHKTKLCNFCKLATEYSKSGDRLVKSSWLCAFLFLFSKRNAVEAEKFVFKLATGSDIKHNTVMFQLRRKLADAARSDSKKIPGYTVLGLIVKAWNYERKGKPKKRLTFNPSNGEKFPTII